MIEQELLMIRRFPEIQTDPPTFTTASLYTDLTASIMGDETALDTESGLKVYGYTVLTFCKS